MKKLSTLIIVAAALKIINDKLQKDVVDHAAEVFAKQIVKR